ncbi:hypothetical protein [Engelhardtia mirabilis]|uniref:Uncharacterized protein n=1 Tax=Engelhardtia mirabilis TaxID=2528011 RepID=A0A518BIB9_9BACT|nr:hypothetical protein Pla133_18050 [Planctomycetes bacterium Pla133]QDV01055.1 hypothetical protein Pla86_18040 [Planctomycetes bacterium Pla86]
MKDKLSTLADLVGQATRRENRHMLVIVLALVLVGSVIGIGAAFPLLSPFLYSMF